MTAYKVMVLGEVGVGKSSLTRRLMTGAFDTSYLPTIGVDVYKYQVPCGVLARPCSLIIWDTDGNLGDAIFNHVYMKEAAGALVVGDVTRRPTLETMLRLAAGFANRFPGRPCSFVLNKTDLLHPREEPELPSALCAPGADLTRTSALTGHNVTEAFHRIAAAIVRRGY